SVPAPAWDPSAGLVTPDEVEGAIVDGWPSAGAAGGLIGQPPGASGVRHPGAGTTTCARASGARATCPAILPNVLANVTHPAHFARVLPIGTPLPEQGNGPRGRASRFPS